MKLALAAALAATSTFSLAQSVVAPAPTAPVAKPLVVPGVTKNDKQDGNWRGSVTVGMSATGGNNEANSLLIAGDGSRVTSYDKISLNGNVLRAQSKTAGVSTVSTDILRLGGRYDRNLSRELFGFGSLNFTRDKVANLEGATVLGVGAGLHVLQEPMHTFDVFGGVGYQRLSYYGYTMGDNTPVAARTTNGTVLILGEESRHKLTDTLSAFQRLTVYPSLKSEQGTRAAFDAGVSAALYRNLSVTVALSNLYSSKPAPGLKKNDYIVTTGLTWSFGD